MVITFFILAQAPLATMNHFDFIAYSFLGSGGNESFSVQFALLERSNPLTFQEIASAKKCLAMTANF
jgi:hypothetical protein